MLLKCFVLTNCVTPATLTIFTTEGKKNEKTQFPTKLQTLPQECATAFMSFWAGRSYLSLYSLRVDLNSQKCANRFLSVAKKRETY